ncbi:MAG TPA: D-alanyl-D-alanine carboxypeptidase/D-alanyl-D-alanine-endopeptidase [Trebonia sp.]|nr:D-alanyl-D-alanine carboxypeptidase/D-alanyl-D-alanine-endopeptidase [Trebonia sp.]
MRRNRATRLTALTTLALVNVFTLTAAVVVAHMLPPRLARLKIPVAASGGPVITAGPVLPAALPVTSSPGGGSSSTRGSGTSLSAVTLPTTAGLASLINGQMPTSQVGPDAGVLITDAVTGKVLYAEKADTPATPASTTKLVTGVAALAVLGPQARFTTSVRQVKGGIVLVGGGDPTLAVNSYPSFDYPQPATLASLAAKTATALKAAGHRSVQLGYDTSLYTGPGLAPGWSDDLVTTGNVTPITSLEADQGRLTSTGSLQDSDDPTNYNPRTTDPAGLTARAFAALLGADGITVTGSPRSATAPAGAATIARVSSPVLSSIVEQMLQESNNVIAENLARHVAIATGRPASFSGGAAAVTAEIRRLGVTTPISLVDGSGLSPRDAIAPATLVTVLATAARDSQVRAVITGLPVAGFTGTLSAGNSVFGGMSGMARGVVRAKTGNLGSVADLAGLVVDSSGRLLIFALMAPRAADDGGVPVTAANAIDAAAVALAACGCQ